MTSAARRLRVVCVLVSAAAVLGVAPRLANAGGETHRAAVVVDLGDEVKTARVTFEGDSITGLEALQLAGFDPVARAYGGQGGAVCSVCERGCPADSTCLTCGGADYWSYFRAASGASSYTYSPVGAGATQVRDGEVEAWKWGPGAAPQFVSFADVWGETTTTAVPATTAPPTTPSTSTRPPATDSPTSAGPPDSEAPHSGGTANTPPTVRGQVDAGGTPDGGAGVAGATDVGSTPTSDGGGTASGAPRTSAGGSEVAGAGAGAQGDGPHDQNPGSRRTGGTASRGVASAGGGGADAVRTAGDGIAAGPVAPRVDTGSGGSVAGVVGFAAVVAGLALWISRVRLTRRRAATA